MHAQLKHVISFQKRTLKNQCTKVLAVAAIASKIVIELSIFDLYCEAIPHLLQPHPQSQSIDLPQNTAAEKTEER